MCLRGRQKGPQHDIRYGILPKKLLRRLRRERSIDSCATGLIRLALRALDAGTAAISDDTDGVLTRLVRDGTPYPLPRITSCQLFVCFFGPSSPQTLCTERM